MKRTGMEDLSSIVRIRRMTFAGHMLWLPLPKPASESIHWKHEKRTTKRDLATNIQGNQLEWCSRAGSVENCWKSLINQHSNSSRSTSTKMCRV